MTTTLYGWDWVGDDEPTTGVLPTQRWISPTSGEIKVRDTSNSTWIYAGNVNNRMGGAVEVAGSTMTGPLLDAPNLPPLQDPDFTGTIRQGGFSVALNTAIAALEKRTYDRIAYMVREQFLSSSKLSGSAANIAAYNTLTRITQAALNNPGLVIPLPVFATDGVTATEAQLLFYGWSVVGSASGATGYYRVIEAGPYAGDHNVDTPVPGSRLLRSMSGGLGSSADYYINMWAFAVR